MAITKNNQGHWRIEGTILYPKINVPYWFDKTKPNPNKPDQPGLSVPVEKTDKRGGYECDLIISDADAKELAKLMHDAFKESPKVAGKPWAISVPKNDGSGMTEQLAVTKLSQIFSKDENDEGIDRWIVKMRQPCYGDPKTKPIQVDKNGVPYPDDFELTTGSKAFVNVLLDPYHIASSGNSGVGVRPKGFFITHLAERVERKDPVNPLDQFSDLVPSNGFEDLAAKPKAEAPSPFASEAPKTETVISGEQSIEVPIGLEVNTPSQDFDDEIPF